MIRVLVVDDSSVSREHIVYILSLDPEIEIIGTARDGEEAVALARRWRPDVVTMDIHMPTMDGFEATRRIMETSPVPIVIVTGVLNPREAATTFRVMEAGALAIVRKPAGPGSPENQTAIDELTGTIKLMSEVKVVRRWPGYRQPTVKLPPEVETRERELPGSARVVAIGASTGGPSVLKTILSGLPRGFPVPILIVQHMAAGFLQGMLDWLSESSGVPLHIAAQGQRIEPGHAYFAPDHFNMGIGEGGTIALSSEPNEERGAWPSVSHLFRSVAEVYGPAAIGILLTGMGVDGAAELRLLKDKGALTFAQDRASSVIYGMPGAAEELQAATFILPPEEIAAALRGIDAMTGGRGSWRT